MKLGRYVEFNPAKFLWILLCVFLVLVGGTFLQILAVVLASIRFYPNTASNKLLKRNVILWNGDCPKLEGKWVAVPAEDFDEARDALENRLG